ncbi:MAG: hypothetical protein C3F13_11095 [Anaerolineales bacterium]|nr:hypothetical protein [Anaerolineae bacterium]PWB52680.1 MAG: hypothetical protein C3F13_11095 [Anaerolineales bacterium]
MRETRNELKSETDRYIDGLPGSHKAFHKVMNYLEVLGMGIIVIAFLFALYFSVAWKTVNPVSIPLAWFTFAACGSLLFILNGVHTAVLGAFPISILPSKASKFVTGVKAMWIGVGLIMGGLSYAAFWVMMAYGTVAANDELLRLLISLLGIALGFGIAISIVLKMVSTTLKKLS